MYSIEYCRWSAAPLAPGSVNKSDLFLSHKVPYRSNISRYYNRFRYIPHEFAKHVYIASICCVIQFGTAVLLFTCSRRIIAWGQHVFVFRIQIAPRILLKHIPLRATTEL